MIRLSGPLRKPIDPRPAATNSGHLARPIWLAWLAIVSVAAPGCSVYGLAKRTLHCELNEYPPVTDAKLACKQYQQWAKQEWQRVQSESGEPYSPDYASGFLQGFVDQVYAGGKPIAPPVPPRKYWRVGYRSERGRMAIESWYRGFEHGATLAHDGGYRQRAEVPSSLTEPMPGSQLERDLEALEQTESVVGEAASSNSTRQQTEKQELVLPVIFNDSVKPTDDSSAAEWNREPPAPPWHVAAQTTDQDEVADPPAERDFDPFEGSIIDGPAAELDTEKISATALKSTMANDDGRSAEPDDKPSATADEGIRLQPIKAVDEPASELKADIQPPKSQGPSQGTSQAKDADSGETSGGAATTEPGWQNKLESNEWKSRK